MGGFEIELNLLRSGVAAALQAASRAPDSVTLAGVLVRDNPFDPERATVTVCNRPVRIRKA
jgi:hypothetical protein